MNEQPKKRTNLAPIIGIIAGVLVVAGGVTAALILINQNSGNNGPDIAKDVKEPHKNDKAYFIKIGDKTFTNQSTIKDLEEAGYKLSAGTENNEVSANFYRPASLANSDKGTGLIVSGYNETEQAIAISSAKLGKISISNSTIKYAQEEYSAMEVYGGIHLGSSKDDLTNAFGEPTDTRESTAYDGKPSQIIEYEDSSFKKYKFTLEDDKVSKIEWINYGKLND